MGKQREEGGTVFGPAPLAIKRETLRGEKRPEEPKFEDILQAALFLQEKERRKRDPFSSENGKPVSRGR